MRLYLQTLPGTGETPRYYQLMLQADLLGGWNLLREWGQQGARGRSRTEHFETLDAALAALEAARDAQVERGYRLVFAQGTESAR